MSNELIGTLLTIIGGFVLQWFINRNQIAELKLKQKELTEKIAREKEESELQQRKTEVDLSNQFLGIATESGRQVVTRDVTIKELQSSLKLQNESIVTMQKQIEDLVADKASMQEQINGLVVDKRKLEDESIRKDSRISALETDNTALRERISVLEKTQIPKNGDCA